jgi:hypothetical protein
MYRLFRFLTVHPASELTITAEVYSRESFDTPGVEVNALRTFSQLVGRAYTLLWDSKNITV